MHKLLTSLVALFLVPCLLADPAMASSVHGPLLTRRTPISESSVFQDQAVTAALAASRFLKPFQKAATLGVIMSMLLFPTHTRAQLSFPFYLEPDTHATLDPNTDLADIPVATKNHPLGRWAREPYLRENPPAYTERKPDGTVSHTFYFPLPIAGYVDSPHMAGSDQERKIAAEFIRLMKNRMSPGLPLYFFFGDLTEGKVATTQRISIRDRDGNLQLGVAIVLDLRANEKQSPTGRPLTAWEIRAILDHEFRHAPLAWSQAVNVLILSDMITDRMATRNLPPSLRSILEDEVFIARDAWGELEDMKYQNRTYIRFSSIRLRGLMDNYRIHNSKRFSDALKAIIDNIYGNPQNPSTRLALETWLANILTLDLPRVQPPTTLPGQAFFLFLPLGEFHRSMALSTGA